MKKTISYIAVSLNGKIARKDGQVDWLDAIPNPDNNDYGYFAFYNSIDATIMGNSTYKLLKSWGIDLPYKGKKNYVLSNKQSTKDDHMTFINLTQVDQIKKQAEKNIWLIGGGVTNTSFLNAGLIDELIIHVMPVIIPDGLDLFANFPKETMLELMHTKHYESGVIELHYKIIL